MVFDGESKKNKGVLSNKWSRTGCENSKSLNHQINFVLGVVPPELFSIVPLVPWVENKLNWYSQTPDSANRMACFTRVKVQVGEVVYCVLVYEYYKIFNVVVF